MNFLESTQHHNWKFTADELRRLREENRQRNLDALSQAQARSASPGSQDAKQSQASAELLTLEEEALLLKYYSSRLQHICRELRLPRRVLGTSLTYLKRIYLALTCLDQDPQQLLLTCLYLACKIEEHYISAAELGRLTGAPAEVILRTELTALQALKFDLIVYSPYKAIEGFLEDLKEAIAAAEGGDDAAAEAAGLDPGMRELSEEQLNKAKAAAYSAADALMASDAPLLHTPGRLALAALRSSFNKLGIKLQRYLERVVRSSGSNKGGACSSSEDTDSGWRQQLQQLQAGLVELDGLGAEGARAAEQAEVVALNQRLKACRSLLQNGSDQAAAKAKAKADKQARKAAKAVEQRSAAEAALGIRPIEATNGGEEPPAKRAKQNE